MVDKEQKQRERAYGRTMVAQRALTKITGDARENATGFQSNRLTT